MEPSVMATQAYNDMLRDLSRASVDHHFEAFRDIDWESPDNAWSLDDDRLILTDADAIGAHPWYKSLPREEQIRVGAFRFAQIAKVGRQFEQVLIAGIMLHLIGMENGNAEFRYAMHEVTEETHHIQMFQEAVNRALAEVGVNPQGAPKYFTRLAPAFVQAGLYLPTVFFVGILAGEEPIDHLQKSVLRAGGTHPLIDRIMQIHVAEEARHISFAHQWLSQRVATFGAVRRAGLAIVLPVVMWWLGNVIMVPCKADREAMGIPRGVARQIWWKLPVSKRRRIDLFADVRMLADQLGLRKGRVRLLWRGLGIDGRPSRFRGETFSREVHEADGEDGSLRKHAS